MDNQATAPSPSGAKSSAEDRLDSWKEIAAYLRREVRTVQRWEKSAGLPVHRLQIDKQGTVYAYKSELDDWYRDRRPQLESDSTAKKRRPLILIGLAAPAAGVLCVAGYRVYQWLKPGSPTVLVTAETAPVETAPVTPTAKVRLAVLPFTNLSGDPRQDYFSAGLS